ncbi:MAG: 50S ribosomal protein L25/general stress protein Ctc [Bacteroidota bacterium]
MKVVSISGSLRENVGKKDANKTRNEGKVPCVLYGGKEQVHFAVDEKSFLTIIYTPEICFVKIDLNGKQYDTVLQEAQFHPVTEKLLHVDFLELVPGKEIIMKVPTKTEGVAPGVLKGGKLIQKMRLVKTRALPENMPEKIVIHIDNLEIGQSVKIGDISAENITYLDNPNSVVYTVRVTRQVEEVAKEGAEGAEKAGEKGAEKAPEKAAEGKEKK